MDTIITVQALPDSTRAQAIANIAQMVAPGGALFVFSAAHDEAEPRTGTPPWPLTRAEIGAFAIHGVELVTIDRRPDTDDASVQRWIAEFRRPDSTTG